MDLSTFNRFPRTLMDDYLLEPSISMDITNSIGLPIELALDFDSYANGMASSLNGPDFVCLSNYFG